MKVDTLGFLLSQKELMTHTVTTEDLSMVDVDVCHLTAAPPSPTTTCAKVLEEMTWLKDAIAPLYRGQPLFGLQHPPIDATREALQELRNGGIAFCGIAYELENGFGGGFATPSVGLTNAGVELLEAMADVGMVLDLSHAGHQTARDAILYIKTTGLDLRVVATHTGCYSVYNHLRNLPDDVLEGIVSLGGFVGIYALTFGLHATSDTIMPFVAHLEYAIHLLKKGAITIGTDGLYQMLDPETQKVNFEMMRPRIDPRGNFRARFPDQPTVINTPRRMDTIAEILNVKEFSSSLVDRLIGNNAYAWLKNAGII